MRTDSQGVYFVLQQYNSMLQDALREPAPSVKGLARRVVICGMGGSGVIGDYTQALCPGLVVAVAKDYSLPAWTAPDDLVVCVSYSGNTEETLSCFSQAVELGGPLLCVTSGGALAERAAQRGVPVARVPQGLPPRFATVSMLVPILKVLRDLGLADAVSGLPGTVHADEDFLRSLSHPLKGKTPLFYASEKNRVLAEKFKTDVNENAKVAAFYNTIPESNHNELNSYEHISLAYAVVFLRDGSDHEGVSRRVAAMRDILRERGVAVYEVALGAGSRAEVLLRGNLMALLLGYHLAIRYGIDPGPVRLIERFKRIITQE